MFWKLDWRTLARLHPRDNSLHRICRSTIMANTVVQTAASGVALKDARLFREACYIDGAWLSSVTGATTNVDNPATGEILGALPKLGVAETRAAIGAANQVFPAWSKKTG